MNNFLENETGLSKQPLSLSEVNNFLEKTGIVTVSLGDEELLLDMTEEEVLVYFYLTKEKNVNFCLNVKGPCKTTEAMNDTITPANQIDVVQELFKDGGALECFWAIIPKKLYDQFEKQKVPGLHIPSDDPHIIF